MHTALNTALNTNRGDPMSTLLPKRWLAAAATIALLTATPITLALPQSTQTTTDDFEADVHTYNDHIVTLANPFLEGRLPGTRGMEIAKEYFEYYLRNAGLEPGFMNGTSYRQPFPLADTVEITRQAVAAHIGSTDLNFTPDIEQVATSMGSSGSFTGPMVFVGYSIDNGEEGYSNYGTDDDLTGAAAIMFRFNPMDEDGKSLWSGSPWNPAAGFDNKIRAAAQRGAAAIIIINTPGAADPRAGQLMSNVAGTEDADIPVMMMTSEAGSALLEAASDRSAMDLRRYADAGGGTVELKGTISISSEIDRNPLMAENVGGLLPGKGRLKDEYIVIGGHLDHVGMGRFGSRSGGKIHPGADDNASGSSAVLMLADKLTKAYAKLPANANARSILFIGFSAEESGLVGSQYYVKNPIAPLEDHDLMLNLDMVGRIKDGRLDTTGTDSAQGFEEWLDPFFEKSDLTILKTNKFDRSSSDHAPFQIAGVPVLFGIIADFHPDYHEPTDFAWKINREDAVRTVYLFRDIALAAAQRPEPFIFAGKENPPANRRAARVEEPSNPPVTDGAAPGGARVRVGIQPSDYDTTDGIPIGAVTENGPAEKAGIRSGDVLISWNKEPLNTIDDYMDFTTRSRPGDVVEIGVRRGENVITLKVTLESAG
jgi:Peptidase family M28/PDZ domain/PA domain